MSTNHDLARAATDKLWKQDRQTFESVSTIIADTYAEPMAELERLKRQVEFVRSLDWIRYDEQLSYYECSLCDNKSRKKTKINHHQYCPNNEVAT